MKYWAYINNEILGPYEKEKLFELPVFSAATLICPQTPVGEKTQDWKEASTYPEVAALLGGAAPAQANPAAAPMPAAAPAPDEPLRAEASPAPLPKPDAAGPEPKIERPAPVFNTEMPESKLKPLSLHKIDQAPPATAPHIEGADFGVSQLGEAKALPTTDPLKSAPSFTSANFKPMTLSQIGKRVGAQLSEGAQPPAEAMSTLSQIDKRAEAQQPAAGAPAAEPAAAGPAGPGIEANKPATASFTLAPVPVFDAPAAAPSPAAPAPGAPADNTCVGAVTGHGVPQTANRSLDEINSRLDALARTSLTKQDIGPLMEKLGQMGEALSSMKNSQFQRDITDKLQHVQNSISDIKASLSLIPSAAPAPAPKTPQAAEIESRSMMTSQPFKPTPAKSAEPAKPRPEQEIEDQGSSGKSSKLAGALKKAAKPLVTLVLLAAVLAVAALFLKQFGVFDVAKFLPFPIPYLSSPPAEPVAPAQDPFQQSGEAQALNKEAGQTGEARQAPTEPPKKDLSPELIYIGRTYALTPGGETLENMIYKDAIARKGDPNKAAWQVKELPENMFELDGVIPLKDNSGQLTYRYEVDYAKKSVKPLDMISKKPMDALLKAGAAARPDRSKTKKNRKDTVRAKPAAAKPAKARPATPAEDEYEYVYEEEEPGGTEE